MYYIYIYIYIYITHIYIYIHLYIYRHVSTYRSKLAKLQVTCVFHKYLSCFKGRCVKHGPEKLANI